MKTVYTYEGKIYIKKRLEVECNQECQARYFEIDSYRQQRTIVGFWEGQ